ncbi:MAG: hypothetical protein ACSHYF_05450 [Verrucomicrobiaceae bacterium]
MTSAFLAALATSASAQLTWTPDTNTFWDLTTANWTDSSSPPPVRWDNTGAQEAIFADPLGSSVQVADGGVVVGNLTTSGVLSLQSVNDNLGRITIKSGGAIWNTGGFEIGFLNDLVNDTPLSILSGDTLAIAGGGTFDTGEKPGTDNVANWVAAGATLDLTESTVVRGNARSIGQFGTVNLVDGSTYIHERNSDESYANDWTLGAGTVVFGNRFNRNFNLNGVVSGEGTLHVLNLGSRRLRLNNVANSFSGGLIIDSSGNRTELFVQGPGLPSSGDGALGAVPATFDPDNIILREGGEIKFLGMVDIDSNRGITLDGGIAENKSGVIAISGSPVTYGGTITGTGGLQVGSTVGNDANGILLTSDTHDYTGGTTIHQGRLILGIDEALPSDTTLTIGGKNSSLFVLNGFTQTLSGLTTAGNNTRQIINFDAATSPSVPATAGTVILDITDLVEADQEFVFGSAFGVNENTDAGNLNIIKNGAGAIRLDNVRVAGTVDINTGGLQLGNSVGSCAVGELTNNASLVIDEAITASSYAAGASSETTFNWEVSDWTGAAGTGFTQLTVTGDVTLDPTSTLNIVVEEADLVNFTDEAASFQITVIGGTTTLTPNFTLDTSGFTSGSGTWALRPDGENLFLDYTAGAAGSYTDWADGFTGLTGGFGDDDDSDGVTNGFEYFFFNSDPTVASNLGAALSANGTSGSGDFVFSHDRPLDLSDVTVTYEWSTALDGDWTASGVENGGTTVTITPSAIAPAATGYETVTLTASSAPATLEKVFVRVVVSMP